MRELLELKALSKRFGGLVAIDNLDLTISPNELLCIIGPNGCGKTTLFNLISGEISSDQGEVLFAGENITAQKPSKVAQMGIVRKFQVPSVFETLSVVENIAVAGHVPNAQSNLTNAAGLDLLRQVGLFESLDHNAAILSHGQKQWLEIAMVLATSPKLLLLDEPTAGMTRAETAKTVELINTIHRQRDVAMIVIEHDMKFVEALGSKVAAMIAGQIITSGSYKEIANDPRVKEVYLGNHAA